MDISAHKPIGICLAQAHTALKTELVDELDRAARENGFGIIAFNSSLDYYWSQKGDHITACIYQMIRFDQLSALVILHDNIYDMHLMNYLVQNAKANHLPVFYLGGTREDCVSITDDYEEPYKDLIRHIIRDHGIRDFFYIAGLQNEDNSKRRLQYFRDVLQENGIPCPEENIAYGNYLGYAAADIVRELAETRPRLPRAILCANDSMAAAVCDELKGLGYRIPEDVVIAGFDGTSTAYLGVPQLSTCSTNSRELADLVADLVKRSQNGETLEKHYKHHYKAIRMESCGCEHFHHPRFNALRTFRQAENLVMHENTLYYSVEQLLELKDRLDIFRKLSATLLPDSALYLNQSLLEEDPERDYAINAIEDELIMIPYRKPEQKLVFRKVYRKNMPLPEPDHRGTHILNVIHSDTLVFGYYAAHTTDLAADAQLIKRMSDVLNLYFCIQEARTEKAQLTARLQNNLYRDSHTGLANLKGLSRWFQGYTAEPENHQKPIALSVCSIARYSWIFETYGMEEADQAVQAVADALRAAWPDALIIARLNEDRFAVACSAEDQSGITGRMDQGEQDFRHGLEEACARSRREYPMDISVGFAMLDKGWENTSVENLIHLATGEMYLNQLKTRPSENLIQDASRLYSSLVLLLGKDLLQYHYQPIVDARTGQIYAYEALMRSGGGIQMNPAQILGIAREYNRLYDVERATLFGIIGQYVKENRSFNGCKVFINTIPGYFLSEEDCSEIVQRYGSYLDCFVMELTEYDPTTDEELDRIKRMSRPGNQMQIAVDDYGSGHNNIVNLLRYSPQIIKIDRALICEIDRDTNKQLFVRNTIDFAHRNNIRTLAEGVETYEELRTVIEFGIDLIQGFYTGRPAPHPAPEIDENIRNIIIQLKLQAVRLDSVPLTHTMADGETADLLQLRLQQINCVRMGSGRFTLTGDPTQDVDMILRVEDDAEAFITFDGICIRGVTEPTVVLGRNSRVTLTLKGENTLRKEGIIVPPDARLTVQGDGNLLINNNRNYSAGIGARYNDPYGTIVLDLEGKMTFSSAGDRVISIGGGRSAGEGIHLLRGSYEISGKGINVVCIGSSLGDTRIRMQKVNVSARGEGNEVLLIGSVSGRASIYSSGCLELSAASERAAGLGTISGKTEITLEDGTAGVSIQCDSGIAIGSFSGEFRTTLKNTRLSVHGEGNQLAGLGSLMGAGETRIESGETVGVLLSGEQRFLGNERSRCVVTGGSFRFPGDRTAAPVSPDGTPLAYRELKEDSYAQTFRDSRESWNYTARRSGEGPLGIFIPQPPES
ncbi:MAG: EAL domain-containing protein [Clostridia bacterium]|nr:EAL domain-containing protein [Clostridia bacterium]